MAARKTPVRRKPPEPPKCEVCKGAGDVAITVRVGRRRQEVGQQSGICLTCFGSGEAPAT